MSVIVLAFSLFTIILFLEIGFFLDRTRSKRIRTFMYFAVTLSFALIALLFVPPSGYDSSTHFLLLNRIRRSNISIVDFLFGNAASAVGAGYSNLLFFNILRLFVSSISNYNQLLPCICALIYYSISFYIIADWNKKNAPPNGGILLSFLLNLTFMPYMHVISGMRNALAASVMGLAVYCFFCKNSNYILLTLLTVIACTIHPSLLIAIPILVITKLGFIKTGIVLSLLGPMALGMVSQALMNTSIPFLNDIARAYLHYSSEGQYRSNILFAWADMILVIIMGFSYFITFKKGNMDLRSKQGKIDGFMIVYLSYLVGNFGNYDLLLRPAYMLGVLSPVLVSILNEQQLWNGKRIIQKGILLLTYLICIMIIVMYWRSFLDAYLR